MIAQHLDFTCDKCETAKDSRDHTQFGGLSDMSMLIPPDWALTNGRLLCPVCTRSD